MYMCLEGVLLWVPTWVYPNRGYDGPTPSLGRATQAGQQETGGWRAIAEKWRQRYELIMCHNRGVVPADCYLMEELKHCLDEEDRAQMDYQRRKNHQLTCREFLEYLQQEYDKDALEQTRSAWQQVQLPPGELTVDKWAMFSIQFKSARDAVDSWTPEEEYRLIITKLPNKWANEVIAWETERKRGQWMVRITNVPREIQARKLKYELEEEIEENIEQVTPVLGGSMSCARAKLCRTRS